jgi:hypothetical protein
MGVIQRGMFWHCLNLCERKTNITTSQKNAMPESQGDLLA